MIGTDFSEFEAGTVYGPVEADSVEVTESSTSKQHTHSQVLYTFLLKLIAGPLIYGIMMSVWVLISGVVVILSVRSSFIHSDMCCTCVQICLQISLQLSLQLPLNLYYTVYYVYV